MQPMLIFSANHPGILYLNGKFAGEFSSETPLMRPVANRGAVYLEYRPLTRGVQSMARKLVFSGGIPMLESVEEADGVNVLIWPGGAVEIELTPETIGTIPQHIQLGGHDFLPDGNRLLCDGRLISVLPDDAEIPELHFLSEGTALIGRCAAGKYLITTDTQLQTQTGFLCAHQIELESDGRIRAIASAEDLVGHATLELWRLTAAGLTLISSEPAWINGAPRWPQTPEETARAAVEAILVGLDSEAERYLAPGFQRLAPLSLLRERCDLCLEMKYAPPQARPCVGLLHLEGSRMGRISPLYFQAVPSSNLQGAYLLEKLEFT